MRGTPRRGRRLGGDAAHQKAMLGNLVASLIAAESLVTTEAKAKALRPVAEKCITAAVKGGVHRHRNVVSLIRDKDMAHKLFVEIAPRYSDRHGRLHPHLEAGPPTGRQRAHGAHRAGLTLFDPDLAAAHGAAVEVGSTPARTSPRPVAPTVERPSTGTPAPRDEIPAVTSRLRLTVSYDGAGFRGFAAQPGQRTVAGELAGAIAIVVGHRVELVCAGRTDAGVHAKGQVVHVDVREGVDSARLVRSVNTLLKPSIVVRSAQVAPPGFDARRSARARRYRYLILEDQTPDPLLAPLSWHVPGPLDLRAMVERGRRAPRGARLQGLLPSGARHRAGDAHPPAGARRPLRRGAGARPASSAPARRLLRFDIEATSFCHQMVRSRGGDPRRGRPRPASGVGRQLAAAERRPVPGGRRHRPTPGPVPARAWTTARDGPSRPRSAGPGRLPGAVPAPNVVRWLRAGAARLRGPPSGRHPSR